MELRQIRYFAAAAEELHFGRAAERCFVAQPALSKQISALERELEVTLFDRSRRRVSLTEAGTVFYAEVAEILRRVEIAGKMARRAGRGEIGELKIGFTNMVLERLVPRIVRSFAERMPDVDLHLHEGCSRTIRANLLDGTLDMGFLHSPTDTDLGVELESVRLIRDEEMFVVLPGGHLLSRTSEIDLRRLADEQFVFFPRDEAAELYDALLKLCNSAGFSPRIVQETGSPQARLALVAAGIGVSFDFGPRLETYGPDIVYKRMTDAAPGLDTLLAWRADSWNARYAAFRDTAFVAVHSEGEDEEDVEQLPSSVG